MEVGSQATNFEHRSYGEELALCKRYYQTWGVANGAIKSTNNNARTVFNKCSPVMRAAPTVTTTWTSGTLSNVAIDINGFVALGTLADTVSLADQLTATADAEL